jgi:two-component system response regulator HydG
MRLPPLRERPGDIPELIHHFLRELSGRQGVPVPQMSADAVDVLRRHPWPGNVRELRNVVEFLFTMSPGRTITLAQIPERVRVAAEQAAATGAEDRGLPGTSLLRRGETLDARLLSLEGELIRKALERCGWNQSQAARMLGITETRIRHRMKRYGVSREVEAESKTRKTPRKKRGTRGRP